MLNKIGIGTANFIRPYGILSDNLALKPSVVENIVETAFQYGIYTFDAAFSYGNFLGVLNKKQALSPLKLIGKFSVEDDYEAIFDNIEITKNKYNFEGYYGLLVHDPQNLINIDKDRLGDFFDKLRSRNLIKKIGVSVYDLDQLELFKTIITPELIQIPVNPFNQIFMDAHFIEYVDQNAIEVHARSLFLQGILLLDDLPKELAGLENLWSIFKEKIKKYPSTLEALLSWALGYKHIHQWILGVSSVENLMQIIEKIQNMDCSNTEVHLFDALQNMQSPLTDPRNWKAI